MTSLDRELKHLEVGAAHEQISGSQASFGLSKRIFTKMDRSVLRVIILKDLKVENNWTEHVKDQTIHHSSWHASPFITFEKL